MSTPRTYATRNSEKIVERIHQQYRLRSRVVLAIEYLQRQAGSPNAGSNSRKNIAARSRFAEYASRPITLDLCQLRATGHLTG